jgi:hypothetical protein
MMRGAARRYVVVECEEGSNELASEPADARALADG